MREASVGTPHSSHDCAAYATRKTEWVSYVRRLVASHNYTEVLKRGKVWNTEGRVRFYLDGDTLVIQDTRKDLDLRQWMWEEKAIPPQRADDMTRGYFADGEIVLFCGADYRPSPEVTCDVVFMCVDAYKDFYKKKPEVYNGVRQGEVGEKIPPLWRYLGNM